jgi:hypothetical protein
MGSHKMHLARIVGLIPVSYYWSAAILGLIFFSISFVITMFLEKEPILVIPTIFLSILLAQQITVIIWAQKQTELLKNNLINFIELPKDEAMKWFDGQESNIFNDKRMILSGISMNILIHFIGLDRFGFSFNSIYSGFSFIASFYIVHYLVGAGSYALVATAWMMHKFSQLPLNINIILSRNIQFKGLLYSKLTICAASIYIMWGLFFLSTPTKLSSIDSIIWFSSFALLLIAYFVLPQYSVHQIITKIKREKLQVFQAELGAKADDTLRNPTKENAACLGNMLDVQQKLEDMSQWPFGSYEVLHIAIIIIIPLVVVALEILFGIIK